MTFDILAVAEPMVDIYHQQISDQQLRDIGLEPGSSNFFDPEDPASAKILESIEQVPVTRKIPGSSPGNFAFNMAMLGHNVAMVTALGQDENGELYHQQIQRYPLTDLSQVIEGGQNAYAHTLFSDGGERTFFAYIGCTPEIDLTKDFPKATFLYTSGYEIAKIGEKVVKMAAGYDGKLVLDPASPDAINMNEGSFEGALPYVRILFASHKEYETLFGEPFDDKNPFRDQDELEIVALKLGSNGSRVFTREENVYVPVNHIPLQEIVNKNGAGDAYSAGFIRGILLGYGIKQAAKLGTDVAEKVLRQEEPHLIEEVVME